MSSPKASPPHADPLARASKFTMLLSRDERTWLYELASGDGVPASVYLRTLIRSQHRDMAGIIEAKANAKVRKK